MSTPRELIPRGSGAISTLPLGLLGFLGIKNGGEYPRELAGYYQPMFDLLDLLAANEAEEIHFANQAIGVAAGNMQAFSTPAQVPQTEVWLVRLFAARIVTGAGDALRGNLVCRRAGVPSPGNVLALSETFAAGASTFDYWTANTLPFWLGPGDELGVWVSSFTAAPAVRPAIRFARFTI